ncbi:adaptor protein MecA [Salipaludibacillus daqingensis]|uniref:adaptor protein MecA n=1 Tax=Salipaludibacillus daqingensis TaxID=3041001 RepID=UPI002474F132|nr:adaptor protein MecA [Salipaludibacillus daqingensis]
MRLERLAYDKMKIFLTYEDLEERGISTDKTWTDVPVIDDMFQDMIAEASQELDFDAEGPVVVEVFSIPAQGVVVIVTKTEDLLDDIEEPVLEWQLSNAQNDPILFQFDNIEHVIQMSKTLSSLDIHEGKLYSFEGLYFFHFHENDVSHLEKTTLVSIMREFGERANVTTYQIEEYGNVIMESMAVQQMCAHFS